MALAFRDLIWLQCVISWLYSRIFPNCYLCELQEIFYYKSNTFWIGFGGSCVNALRHINSLFSVTVCDFLVIFTYFPKLFFV